MTHQTDRQAEKTSGPQTAAPEVAPLAASPKQPESSEQPNEPEQAEQPSPAPQDPQGAASQKIPWPLKLFGVLNIISGSVMALLMLAFLGAVIFLFVAKGPSSLEEYGLKVQTIVFAIIEIVIELVLGVLYFRLGISLLRNRRHHGVAVARTIQIMLVISLLITFMLTGPAASMLVNGVLIGIMVALQSYLDPTLADERKLSRKLKRLDRRAAEEARVDHLEKSRGKAPYRLNFFNIFWTFVICSIIGLILEVIFHAVMVGGYEDRAGLLFGPFSPIYGFGAVLMTLALNGIRNKNVLLIFVLSAIIGGAFEYFVSWFMQFAFGITAWDYTGTFLSIDGRTNGFFMACWGVLGVAWVKLLLPMIFKLIYLIPWNLRYIVTTVATVAMVLDGAMTLLALDCWYERASGDPIDTPIEEFYSTHFDDDWMEGRFQSMTMDSGSSTRVPGPTGA